jgi:hypothetical protein
MLGTFLFAGIKKMASLRRGTWWSKILFTSLRKICWNGNKKWRHKEGARAGVNVVYISEDNLLE